MWGQENRTPTLAYYDDYVKSVFEEFKSQRLESLSKKDDLENFDQDFRDASEYQEDYKYLCLRSNRLFTFATYPYVHPKVDFSKLFRKLSDIPEAELLNQLAVVAQFIQTDAADLDQIVTSLSLSPPEAGTTTGDDQSINEPLTMSPYLLRQLERMPKDAQQNIIAHHNEQLKIATDGMDEDQLKEYLEMRRRMYARQREFPQAREYTQAAVRKASESDLPQAVTAVSSRRQRFHPSFRSNMQEEAAPYQGITQQFKAGLNADAYAADKLQETYLILSLWGNFSDPFEKVFLSTLFQTLETPYDPSSHKYDPYAGRDPEQFWEQDLSPSDLLASEGLMGAIVPHKYNGLFIPKRYNLILPSMETGILDEIRASLEPPVRSLKLGRTLLHYLAFQADTSLLSRLRHEPDVIAAMDLTDNDGNTLFLLACKYGTLETMRVLLELPLAHNTLNLHGDSCLHLAIENPNPEVLLYLIRNLNESELITALDAVNEDLQTPLLKSIGLTTRTLLEADDNDLSKLFGSKKLKFPSYNYLYYVPLLDKMEELEYEIQPVHRQMPFFEFLKIEKDTDY
jgi:hypothetical protein